MEKYEIYSARTKRRKIKALVDNFLSDVEQAGPSDENPVPLENCNVLLSSHHDESANDHLPDISVVINTESEGHDVEDSEGNLSDNELSSTDDNETDHETRCSDDHSDNGESIKIREKLASWAVNFKISHSALSALLEVLKSCDLDVPKDPRTLLMTPRVTDIKETAGFRRIKNKKYLDSDSDSESSRIDDQPIFTNNSLPSPPHSLVSGACDESPEAIEVSPLPSTSTSSTVTPTSTLSRAISPKDVEIPAVDQSEPLRKLVSLVYSIKETQQVHTGMLQSLSKKVSGVVTEASTLPEGLKFPLETVGQLEEMETQMIDPGVRSGLVNVLAEIGGNNIDQCVRRVMKFLMRDTLATKLNMSGRNNKKALGPTNLFETIYRGVKKNPQTSHYTRKDVEHSVAKWLIGGRDRSGNRMRRANGATLPSN